MIWVPVRWSAIALCAAVATAAIAQQHAGPSGSTVRVEGPYSLAVFGAFQRMVHTQDFSAKVKLDQVVGSGATEGVGAVEGLRGEVTLIDGKLLVSYGAPCNPCGSPSATNATLLSTVKVAAWRQAAVLPSDLVGAALDDYIVARAKEAGHDMSRPLPVRLDGTLISVKMHVLRAPNPGFKGHGSGHTMADQENIVAGRIDGEVVGFYAPAAVQGIFTHPGEPFHYHWTDKAHTRTAHLDVFGMAKGARLLLPAR